MMKEKRRKKENERKWRGEYRMKKNDEKQQRQNVRMREKAVKMKRKYENKEKRDYSHYKCNHSL